MEQNISWRVTDLLLVIASSITAAIFPDNKDKKAFGRLVVTNNGAVANQMTCSRDQTIGYVCNWTETKKGSVVAERGLFSRTSEAGNITSSITVAFSIRVRSITDIPSTQNHTSFN